MAKSINTPTMKDVAREAGVALGTVSKVFNGIPVGEQYRIKVEKAAEKLGYSVNNYARALRSSRSNTVAVIVPTLTHPFFGSLAEYCCRALREKGCSMIVATSDFDIEAEKKCLAMVRQNKVDGIICLSYNPDLQIADDIPFVSFDRYYSAMVPCVCADNYGGGQLAAQKLVEFGCKKLLMLHEGSGVSGEPDKREHGFVSWCLSHQIPYDTVIYHADHDWKDYWDFIDAHTTDGMPDYDGIFCGTDHLAYVCEKELRARGIRVPEDVQIIGFDGVHKFTSDDYFCSTIVQPIEQMAYTCVDLLFRKNNDYPPLVCLPVTFKYGGTTRKSEPSNMI